MKDWIAHFQAARGMPVSLVQRGYGSALLIELGRLAEAPRRDNGHSVRLGEIGIMIEWSWRIEEAASIICGSWSDEPFWRPAFDRVTDQTVVGLSVFGRLPEILLSLSDDLHVASFMTAEGDPEWTLFDRRTPEAIVVGCRSGQVARME